MTSAAPAIRPGGASPATDLIVAPAAVAQRDFSLKRVAAFIFMVFGMFIGDVVVGGCGLHRRLGADGLEIGYWVHAAHVRRGYAARATEMLTSVAFSFPEIDLVEIHCDRSNSASQGVPRKLGFILIGQQTKPIQAPSETGLDDVWRLTRSEWMPDA